jgi:hypothetical protein
MSQAQFLQQWGIEELVLEGKEYWEKLSGAPDVAAIKMRSRMLEANNLIDLKGLGNFSAIQWSC